MIVVSDTFPRACLDEWVSSAGVWPGGRAPHESELAVWHNSLLMPRSSQLTITVTPELEAFVRDRVASGRFDTASDVVREGLKLLEGREHEREAAIAEIRAEIAVGLDQARAGQLRDGETFFEELARKSPS